MFLKTDNSIRLAGMKILNEKLGAVDAERFISLISRENLNQNISVRELSRKAADCAKNLKS